MIFLIGSIFCSVLVSVLLKIARSQGVHLAVAIAVNYFVCALLTALLLKPELKAETLSQGAIFFAALGILLPSVFLIMGKAVEEAGIVKSDTAQRLALIIPILAAFLIFGESLNAAKVVALVLVFLAMGCLLYKKNQPNQTDTNTKNASLWLIGVFFGYGVIDVLLKQLSKMGGATAGNLIVSFVLALAFMIGVLTIKKIKANKSSVVGGLVLGALNFANIYTYIAAHKAMADTPTLVFAGMNMGVIALGVVVGIFAFKEKLHPVNALGVALALTAIGGLYLA